MYALSLTTRNFYPLVLRFVIFDTLDGSTIVRERARELDGLTTWTNWSTDDPDSDGTSFSP